MTTANSIANLTLLHSAELLAFSIVLFLILESPLKKAIAAWIARNILTVLFYNIYIVDIINNFFPIAVFQFLLGVIVLTIPYYSVNFGRGISTKTKIVYLLICSVWTFSAFLEYGRLTSFISYSGGAAVVAMCAWAAHTNSLWKGLPYRHVLTAGFIACAIATFWRGTQFIGDSTPDGFLIDADPTKLGLSLILVSSVLLQIGFIGVVVSHDFRRRRRMDREAAEAREISLGIAVQQRLMEKVAEERLDMISLLTHEVRQPINNAQAALQALARETKGSARADDEIGEALARAQSVIDGITLAISNAILAVSLIDNKQAIAIFSSDLAELVALALSDCPAEQRHRVHVHCAPNAVFSNLDPVLIRLALRNLLDNAFKYSPKESSVHVEIEQDEERLGASIKISSQMKDASGINENVFGNRVRGTESDVEGSGHGLYLVHKVAEAHAGTITYEIEGGHFVTFDLFIPD